MYKTGINTIMESFIDSMFTNQIALITQLIIGETPIMKKHKT